ncbi:hypothetical protein [Kutzneria sp. NPDC052558]|uniref:hypothetical protein n=1 Tax=Kutzneria sp. NPDC052558 TaxID=3364121 RepID=UPI0037C9D805
MPGNLMHLNATVMCPHGGRAVFQPSQTRGTVTGQVIWTVADLTTITGCPFFVGNKPQPCVTVQWITPSARIRVNGSQVLTQGSTGLCLSAEHIPQGAPVVSVIQQRTVGQ